jgi:Fur family ferric uptake transcriptional regulator
MSCEEFFLDQLRARGFRMTPQREIILAVLHGMEGLVTVEEVHSRVQKVSAVIDVSTVYRTLDLLQEFGLVSCVDVGDGQHRYELVGLRGPHVHLICQGCGKVMAVEPDVMQAFAERLEAAKGFQIALDRLSLPGFCQDCVASKGMSKAPSSRRGVGLI